jgi:predicted  nucleic acid-binding Zn-ribbon protein
VVKKRVEISRLEKENESLKMTEQTLRTELTIAHDRLTDIAEHYDETHESAIPALGFLNLKEKA